MQKLSTKQRLGLIVLGIFLCLSFLEVGMRLWSAIILFMQEQRNKVPSVKKDEYRILCLGESTTAWGDGSSWPLQLEQVLNQKNIGIKFKVINKGRYSIQTSYIVSAIEDNINKYNPDMVISMIGINDGDNTVPYEQGNNCELSTFFNHLKIYKLAKLLWLHVTHKLGEFRNYKLRNEMINQKNYNIESGRNDMAYVQLGKEHMSQRQYLEAGQLFKKALEINPRNDEAFVGLGWCYSKQRRFIEAIEMINKAREINPKNIWAYTELGNYYRELGRYADAEGIFKEALELYPEYGPVYAYLGFCYKEQGHYKKAEEMFKKAIEISPDNGWINGWAYIQLGICYRDQTRYDEAEKILKKAIEINPRNWEAHAELIFTYRELSKDVEEEIFKRILEMECDDSWTYLQMGWYYADRGRYAEAEEVFKKVIEIDRTNLIAYIELSNLYRKQKKMKEEEALFKKAEKLIQRDDRFYGRLATYYLDRGDYTSAEKYFEKADSIRMQYYPSATRHNYQKLKDIVTQRGIKLICVQYPMRKLEPLKKLFDSTEGIVFVDNEKIFKDVLRHVKYEDYFADNFAGDFGHCTPKGNRLLAENVANVILKEYFGN